MGSRGVVIGVDFNEPMLKLARKYQDGMARKLGYSNVRFVKAKIQDLQLDLEQLEDWLSTHPVSTLEGWAALEAESERFAECAR